MSLHKLDSKFPINIGLIADLHAGETRSIMLPRYVSLENMVFLPNKIQRILYKHWQRVKFEFEKFNIKYLFNVGDSFAGENLKESGAYVFLKNPDQLELGTQLILDLLGKRKEEVSVLTWRGTTYHELKAGQGEMHLELTKRLRSEGVEAEFMGEQAYIEIEGAKKCLKRIYVAHEAPLALVYPATTISRDIDWFIKASSLGLILKVDSIIRAHVHRWLYIEQDGLSAITLPAWTAYVPYSQTIKYFPRLQPSIGAVILSIDELGHLTYKSILLPLSYREQLAREVVKLKKLQSN